MTTNLGEENAIGLIINFSSAIIISEIDDFATKLGRVQAMREDYEKLMGEGKEQIMKKKAKKRVRKLYNDEQKYNDGEGLD